MWTCNSLWNLTRNKGLQLRDGGIEGVSPRGVWMGNTQRYLYPWVSRKLGKFEEPIYAIFMKDFDRQIKFTPNRFDQFPLVFVCNRKQFDNRSKLFGAQGARSHDHGKSMMNLGSDSINQTDLCAPQLDLRVTVYPDDGNQPAGVSHSKTFAARSRTRNHRSILDHRHVISHINHPRPITLQYWLLYPYRDTVRLH
jgi:hypothetical protein